MIVEGGTAANTAPLDTSGPEATHVMVYFTTAYVLRTAMNAKIDDRAGGKVIGWRTIELGSTGETEGVSVKPSFEGTPAGVSDTDTVKDLFVLVVVNEPTLTVAFG